MKVELINGNGLIGSGILLERTRENTIPRIQELGAWMALLAAIWVIMSRFLFLYFSGVVVWRAWGRHVDIAREATTNFLSEDSDTSLTSTTVDNNTCSITYTRQ
jgi:hypothetical protein